MSSGRLVLKLRCESKADDDAGAARGGGAASSGRQGPTGPQPVRSSTRILKRPKRDFSPPASPPKKPLPKEQKEKRSRTPKVGRTGGGAGGGGGKRNVVWSQDDKNAFFEAVAEHGKNFEAIKSHLEKKHLGLKLDPSLVKTKEQVRHLYYRTWSKISKHIDENDDIVKHARELYGLINYGEMRKKIGQGICLDEKTGAKLNELVHKGTATIRLHKKYFRLKTPACPALQKLNKLKPDVQTGGELKDEGAQQTRLPDKLTLELKPRNNRAWTRVQSLSQNPRVRLHLKAQHRLSGVIDFLSNKWKSPRLRLKEEMKEEEEPRSELRLLPPEGSEIRLFEFALTTNPSSAAPYNMQQYTENLKRGKIDQQTRGANNKKTKDAASPDAEQSDVAGSAPVHDGIGFAADENAQLPDEGEFSPRMFHGLVGFTGAVSAATANLNFTSGFLNDPGVSVSGESGATPSAVAPDAPGGGSSDELPPPQPQPPLAPGSSADQLDSEPLITLNNALASPQSPPPTAAETGRADGGEADAPSEDAPPSTEAPPPAEAPPQAPPGDENKEDPVKRAREGWRRRTAENTTVGEVYLLLGSPDKLVLEYEWVDVRGATRGDDDADHTGALRATQLTNTLRRLMHLAATEFTDYSKHKHNALANNKSPTRCKCVCGRGAQSGTPPNAKGRSPRVTAPSTSAAGGTGGVHSPATPKTGGRGGVDQASAPNASASTADGDGVGRIDGVAIPSTTPGFIPKDSVPRTAPIPVGGVTEPTTVTVSAGGVASDGVFRIPTAAPVRSVLSKPGGGVAALPDRAPGQTLDKQLEFLMPRRRTRMPRTRKPLIVQRRLVPKQDVPTRHIMTLAMVPNATPHSVQTTGSFLPVQLLQGSEAAPLVSGSDVVNVANSIPSLSQVVSSSGVTAVPQIPGNQANSSQSVPPPGDQILASHADNVPRSGQLPDTSTTTVLGSAVHTLQLQPNDLLAPVLQGQAAAPVAAPVAPPVDSGGGGLPPILPPPDQAPFVPITASVLNSSTTSSTQVVSTLSSQPLSSSVPASLQPVSPVPTHTIVGDASSIPLATSSPLLRHNNHPERTLTEVAGLLALPGSGGAGDGAARDAGGGDPTTPLRPAPSPCNLSGFLDISLPSNAPDTSEKLIDLALGNSNSNFSVSGLLDGVNVDTSSVTAGRDLVLAAISPTKPPGGSSSGGGGKPPDAWLTSEDFSLSQLLESPLKRPGDAVTSAGGGVSGGVSGGVVMPSFMYSDSSRDSLVTRLDVDSALQCMMNENSLDYVAKFADLAAQITDNDHHGNSAGGGGGGDHSTTER